MRGIMFALTLLATIFVSMSSTGQALTDIELTGLSADYQATSDPEVKTKILEKFLQAGSKDAHIIFYTCFTIAEDNDLPCFKAAFAKYGTGQALVDLSAYVSKLINPLIEEASKHLEDMEEYQKQADELSEKINSTMQRFTRELSPEIKAVALRDHQILISSLKAAFDSLDSDIQGLFGPLTGLTVLEERGMELLLASVQNDADETMVFSIFESFGENAVIPTLKLYEDPSSSEVQKELAGIIILGLPDTEPVMDKVIEAWKHGRYFERKIGQPDKDGKITITAELGFKMASIWWGNMVITRYKDNKTFIHYVARKYLLDPNGQDDIISLLTRVDPELETVLPYFKDIDFRLISNESLENLKQIFFQSGPSFSSELSGVQFDFFYTLFKGLDKQKREDSNLVFDANYFPIQYQKYFLIEYFSDFTDKEKGFALYSILGRMSKDDMEEVSAEITQYCNEDQRGIIEYLRNK